ncbi:alpha/beta fold hydrolase [Buchnera aphidicola]|uniref:Pimeloyl-[acyl-carrier protein] methyl ester esterase n=1 Tax=Buchnera aphidicola (Cinara curvipes) TaxID=2518975 RepID=A0A451D719_9GAMM|nr:alpha/beta fold hydrolase [Buchnera aphidicola]VFP81640.1 Pimeloyl-[acyl-carrier protein] methyl ester esterase [Buchnera aphidicola (Cinara curvipes)]
MNKKIYWSIIGKGKINIVFFHGWGIHSIVWNKIIPILKLSFTLHIIDLPGFGKSINCSVMNFKEISNYLLKKIKKKVIWLGWSMGGLIAHYMSLNYPNYTIAMIHVTSSPFFIKKKEWLGVSKNILKVIKKNIFTNYNKFLKQFIILHVFDKKIKNLSINNFFLKKYPNPKKKAIEVGYRWLTEIDQRNEVLSNNIPVLKIYGELDKIVPREICYKINYIHKNSNSIIIKGAKHAPFLSHPNIFCNILKKFIKNKKIDN